MGFGFDQGDSARGAGADKSSDGGSHLPVLGSDRRRFHYTLLTGECGLDFPKFNAETATFHLPVEPSYEQVVAVRRARYTISNRRLRSPTWSPTALSVWLARIHVSSTQ